MHCSPGGQPFFWFFDARPCGFVCLGGGKCSLSPPHGTTPRGLFLGWPSVCGWFEAFGGPFGHTHTHTKHVAGRKWHHFAFCFLIISPLQKVRKSHTQKAKTQVKKTSGCDVRFAEVLELLRIARNRTRCMAQKVSRNDQRSPCR